jgi:hypothetical protein
MLSRKRTLSLLLIALAVVMLGCPPSTGVAGATVGLSLFGGIAVGVPGGQLVGGIALIGQCVGVVVLGFLENLAVASSFPDADFDSIAIVEPVHFELLSIPQPFAESSLDTAVIVAGKLIDDSRMLNLSLRKYYGAVAAQSTAGAQLQKTAACNALSNLNADLQAYSNALAGVSTEIQGTPAASVSGTVADVLNLRDQIVSTGSFPEFEAGYFSQANVSPEELSQALGIVASVTDQSITDAGLGGAVIFDRAAQKINHVNAAVFLPQGFTCDADSVVSVPTLSPWGAVAMVLLLAAASLYAGRKARRI